MELDPSAAQLLLVVVGGFRELLCTDKWVQGKPGTPTAMAHIRVRNHPFKRPTQCSSAPSLIQKAVKEYPSLSKENKYEVRKISNSKGED